ncbi:hypothetical protein MEX01_49110 [Methylorubrum extorquens]|nr:hypothetical protein MEX01_49110 [Methylorubrum extorquens]
MAKGFHQLSTKPHNRGKDDTKNISIIARLLSELFFLNTTNITQVRIKNTIKYRDNETPIDTEENKNMSALT